MKEYDQLCNDLRFGTQLLFREGDPWGHIAVRLREGDKLMGSYSSMCGFHHRQPTPTR